MTWRTLTFGDLVPGDVVRLDEEGPEETVRHLTHEEDEMVNPLCRWYRTDLSARWVFRKDPVLVRFPRPEVEA